MWNLVSIQIMGTTLFNQDKIQILATTVLSLMSPFLTVTGKMKRGGIITSVSRETSSYWANMIKGKNWSAGFLQVNSNEGIARRGIQNLGSQLSLSPPHPRRKWGFLLRISLIPASSLNKIKWDLKDEHL